MRQSTIKRIEEFRALYQEGYSRLDIMAKMGFKSSQTYYVYLELMKSNADAEAVITQNKAKKVEPVYVEEKKGKAIPVTIRGQRYLDVTSFFI